MDEFAKVLLPAAVPAADTFLDGTLVDVRTVSRRLLGFG